MLFPDYVKMKMKMKRFLTTLIFLIICLLTLQSTVVFAGFNNSHYTWRADEVCTTHDGIIKLCIYNAPYSIDYKGASPSDRDLIIGNNYSYLAFSVLAKQSSAVDIEYFFNFNNRTAYFADDSSSVLRGDKNNDVSSIIRIPAGISQNNPYVVPFAMAYSSSLVGAAAFTIGATIYLDNSEYGHIRRTVNLTSVLIDSCGINISTAQEGSINFTESLPSESYVRSDPLKKPKEIKVYHSGHTQKALSVRNAIIKGSPASFNSSTQNNKIYGQDKKGKIIDFSTPLMLSDSSLQRVVNNYNMYFYSWPKPSISGTYTANALVTCSG